MSKLRILFVLFSLVVLAGNAGAQERGRRGGDNRGAGSIIFGNGRVGRNGGDEEDDENRGGIRDRRGGDDNEDENDDEQDDEDRGRAGQIGQIGGGRDCVDQNGRNVCDGIFNGGSSTRLPDMINAVLISRGRLTPDGMRWLGANTRLTPRFARQQGRAVPRRVDWVDGAGRLAQVWLDNNGDRRADVVQLYRGGRLMRTFRR
jgi:hypothetical protein